MEFSNSDVFIRKIWFRSIRINPILNYKNIFLSIKKIEVEIGYILINMNYIFQTKPS